jgi:hypothetical protein
MTKEEKLYTEIGEGLKGAEMSQMFGKPALKTKGKAFACFFQDCMVFKLTGDTHAKALKLKGSKLFDPSGSGRAMKEWVQVTYANKKNWAELAKEAMNYVAKN